MAFIRVDTVDATSPIYARTADCEYAVVDVDFAEATRKSGLTATPEVGNENSAIVNRRTSSAIATRLTGAEIGRSFQHAILAALAIIAERALAVEHVDAVDAGAPVEAGVAAGDDTLVDVVLTAVAVETERTLTTKIRRSLKIVARASIPARVLRTAENRSLCLTESSFIALETGAFRLSCDVGTTALVATGR